MESTPCLIVGGGPSGVSTALFLAEAAPEFRHRILVIEKEHYPREKICAGALGGRADKLLGAIGVVVDVPSASIAGVSVRVSTGTHVVREGHVGRVVRRHEFDHALAEAARRRGIRVIDGVKATSFDVRSDAVVVATNQGEIRARAVVGADGVASTVRRSMGVPASLYVAQALEVDTEPLPDDPERDLLHFDFSRGDLRGYQWNFPTIVDGRRAVSRGVYVLRSREPAKRAAYVEIEDVLASALRERGLDLSTYRKKRYAERGFFASGELSQPRRLLVGEAAGIDPLTGEGIAQAIQFGAVAGPYLAQRLRAGDVEFEDWARTLRSTSVGRDLFVRTRALPFAYGRYRNEVGRFVLDTPDFLRVGLQHFGGKPRSARAVTRSMARAGIAAAKKLLAGR